MAFVRNPESRPEVKDIGNGIGVALRMSSDHDYWSVSK